MKLNDLKAKAGLSTKKSKKDGKGVGKKKRPSKKQPNFTNNIFVYLLLAFVVYIIFISFGRTTTQLNQEMVPVSEVVSLIRNEQVQSIDVSGDTIEVLLRDGSTVYSKKESTVSFEEILANSEVDRSKIVEGVTVSEDLDIASIISTVLLYGIPIAIFIFIFRQMRSASSDVLSFGKSKAKMFSKESSKITFNDVAGVEEAKNEMVEIVDFLKNPKKYQKLGARVPKGVLLVGPAGVGKTLLAKAIAGEANVPFFNVAGSEFMEMLVGVGSSRVRDLFNMAKQTQPSLIFIDEIDAIGRQRGMGIGGGHDEREQTLNQILVEMDGFDERTQVIVIAATNRADMLDPALVRAGRFDRKIVISMPDLEARKEIIEIHMKGKPFAKDFDLEKVAKKTVGFSGADIENMLNEAAILAARDSRQEITMKDIDNASLKVTLGPERRKLQDEDEKKMVAYHEAGHALVGANVPDLDPIGRVTIIPRGGSLGHTSLPPSRDRYNETKTRLLSMLTMMMGGRAAESLVFNEMTTGAAGDIEQATKVARKMVTEYGMSSLGPISFDSDENKMWLARQLGENNTYSDTTASQIDTEVKQFVDSAYAQALKILTDKRKVLDKIADALLEKETIDEEEFKKIIGA